MKHITLSAIFIVTLLCCPQEAHSQEAFSQEARPQVGLQEARPETFLQEARPQAFSQEVRPQDSFPQGAFPHDARPQELCPQELCSQEPLPQELLPQKEVLTLEECQQAARQNFPAVAGYDLVERLADFNIANARRNWLPRVSLNALAAWLSEVPALPADVGALLHQLGVDAGEFPEFQYGAAVQVRQTIWDGGAVRAGVRSLEAQRDLQRAQLDTEIYALRQRVNQLYFGTLLLQQRLHSIELLFEDLERNYRALCVAVECGRAEPNDAERLCVEMLSVRQQCAELRSLCAAYMAMLGVMTGLPVSDGTHLETPALGSAFLAATPALETPSLGSEHESLSPGSGVVPPMLETLSVEAAEPSQRPELAAFDARGVLLEAQRGVVDASVRPRIFAFATGGYSLPAPNVFRSLSRDAKPSPYLFAGVGLSWSLDGFYTRRNRLAQIVLEERQVALERDVFLYENRLQRLRDGAAIRKLTETMRYDDEIIERRAAIRRRTEVRVANGESSADDLLRDMNAEESARQSRLLHEVELLEALCELANTVNR